MKTMKTIIPTSVLQEVMDAMDDMATDSRLLDMTRSRVHQFDAARDALRAALEQPQNHVPDVGNMVPDGWKLVPVELTHEMLRAGRDAHYEAEKRIQDQDAWSPGGFAKRAVRAAHVFQAMLAAALQPPVVEECLTDELKPRFSAHDDAERLKSVARGMSYNDHGEAVWKHTLMEIAVRLESGGYAAPQPPALERQVEQESTCKDYLQVEQEPRFFYDEEDALLRTPGEAQYGPEGMTALYIHPQLQRQPLTDEQIDAIAESMPGGLDGFLKGWGWRQFASAVLEAALQPPALGRPQSNPAPYLWYDPENGDTWTKDAVDEGFCVTDNLIPLYTK